MTEPGETLGELGETAVLARIFPRLPASDAALLGPGDDAAVLAAPDGRYVVTTDLLVEGPDFVWAWSAPADLGWKAAASNLADVAAMGARPTALLVALAAPPDTDAAVLEGVADGFRAACEALAPGCGVVGGDLSASRVFTIAVTAFGNLDGRSPVLRSGARAGDVVAVAGELGVAGRGLRLLVEQGAGEGGPHSSDVAAALAVDPHAVSRQLRPEPPIEAGVRAAAAGATAMMDVSDGLALDARRLAIASGVDLDLFGRALGGTAEAVREALGGGEDHSLLATFSSAGALPGGFRQIGLVRPAVDEPRVLLDGEEFTARGGWDPYRP